MSLISSLIPSIKRTAAPADTAAGPSDLGPTIKPAYELNETTDGFSVTVQLPGVDHAGLELNADADSVSIVARRTWKQPEGWTSLYRESTDTAYELVLSHENVIDLDKIQAELRDGVLRISLVKTEAVKPRKITVS
jgi:HSP20 family protein